MEVAEVPYNCPPPMNAPALAQPGMVLDFHEDKLNPRNICVAGQLL